MNAPLGSELRRHGGSLHLGAFLGLLLFPLALLNAADDPPTWQYRGFSINHSRIAGAENIEAVRATMHEQIDRVCAVELSPAILSFFQRVPLHVVPYATLSPNVGLYVGEQRAVKIADRIATWRPGPHLLHEFLHALHHQHIPAGFNNRDITAFFQRAKEQASFPATSHMMRNEREFFACAATAYLHGITEQEPFRREKIKENQPAFFAHLAALFGSSAANYEGTLPIASPTALAANTPANERARLERIAEIVRTRRLDREREQAAKAVAATENSAAGEVVAAASDQRSTTTTNPSPHMKGTINLLLPDADMETVATACKIYFGGPVAVADRVKGRTVYIKIPFTPEDEFRKIFLSELARHEIFLVNRPGGKILDSQPW
jgi:hypothetical protein